MYKNKVKYTLIIKYKENISYYSNEEVNEIKKQLLQKNVDNVVFNNSQKNIFLNFTNENHALDFTRTNGIKCNYIEINNEKYILYPKYEYFYQIIILGA